MLLSFCFVLGGGGGDLVHTPSIGYNNDILISLMSVDLDLDHLEI